MKPYLAVRDVVRVSGPDAFSFLQGQLSQDLAPLAAGESAWSFILQPQGKVDALVKVTKMADDTFDLDVDPGFGDAVAQRLNRFKLRTKCDINVVEQHVHLDDAAPEAARIDDGWPAMGKELDDRTIPGETGLVDLTVSFTKGCYTGQELVARIDSRGGNVPRHLRRLRAAGDRDVLTEGAPVTVDGKEVGAVTSASGRVALAYVGRAVEPPARGRVGDVDVVVEAISREGPA